MSGNYTIEFRQYPIVLNLAGHNYVVLKDGQGNVVREIHGLAADVEGH
jgi:hypothetical protein